MDQGGALLMVSPHNAIPSPNASKPPAVDLSRPSETTLLVRFSGEWLLANEPPGLDEFETQLAQHTTIKRVEFDVQDLGNWDSALVTLLLKIFRAAQDHGIDMVQNGLPDAPSSGHRCATEKGCAKGSEATSPSRPCG